MAPLIVLLTVFAGARFASRYRVHGRALSGRIALATMFVLTGVAHFTHTAELAAMVPPILPAPTTLVHGTGLAELLFALLLVCRGAPWLGWLLAGFLIALLPANVYASMTQVGMGDHGPSYLWFRIPLQLLFVGWALASTGAWHPKRSWVRALHAASPRPRVAGW